MKYPIDVEKYIAAACEVFGADAVDGEIYREVIPVVNLHYERGRKGVPGYPMDPEAKICKLKKTTGEEVIDVELLTRFINWCNEAYQQGRQSVGEAVVV